MSCRNKKWKNMFDILYKLKRWLRKSDKQQLMYKIKDFRYKSMKEFIDTFLPWRQSIFCN